MSTMLSIYVLCLQLVSLVSSVGALPPWQSSTGHIGSLVAGAAAIEAVGTVVPGARAVSSHHLSSAIPGNPGNLTLLPSTKTAPSFILANHQLWNYVNETTLLPVNIVNASHILSSTEQHPVHFPVQLVLGTRRAGIGGGSWRWRGAMLYYDHDNTGSGNGGVFYKCTMEGDQEGLFMFLLGSATPPHCELFTLHSFSRREP